ncbi:MAG: LysM peptidoglycan-binding domain-containing protein [Chloroflexota bacterium]
MPNWRVVGRGRARRVAAAASMAGLLLMPATTQAFADTPVATTHVVQPSETLLEIANSVGVDPATLAALNALEDANLLRVGQALKLPASSRVTAPAPVATSAAAATPRTYTAVAGDTLWAVAEQFATTTAALLDANHLDDPDYLVAGVQLVLPSAAAVGSDPQTASTAPAASLASASAPPEASARPVVGVTPAPSKRRLFISYTVQPGETLGRIARQFGVDGSAIAHANSLDDANRLSVGTVLKVPLPGREHVVQAGETLRDIAAQEKVDLGSLIDFNALDDPQLIHVGQAVLVPAAASAQTAASSEPVSVGAKAAPRVPVAPPSPTPPAPKAALPVTVVAPPTGSGADGLAGAGLKLLGAPYAWGGSTASGFDCSGFVWYVARQAGKQLSRGMLGEYTAGPHPARDELKPGDIVFFQNTYSAGLSHAGIYIGNGQFVHAADEAVGVTVSSLGTLYWTSHWFGATRLT